MSQYSPRSGIARWLFVLLTFSASLCAAEEAKKVISTSSVNAGDHKITFQRVEPPKETAAPAAVMSTQAAAADANRERAEALSLSCTIYDAGVTEVRWSAGGAEYRVLSNVDFNHLRSVGGFTADGRSYTVFMGIGRAMAVTTQARGQADGALISAAPAMPPVSAAVLSELQKSSGARYAVLAAPAGAESEAYRGIDALHHYYDAHKSELIAAWQQSEAARVAHEQYEKEHPPAPKDTVIQFWPKKGSRYLGTTTGAADATTTSGKEGK